MRPTTRIRIAAITGAAGVILGAFGAHGLQGLLKAHDATSTWETAVFYHLIHSVVLFFTADRTAMRTGPWWCMLLGIIVFSGTLYVLSLTGLDWLGAITPLGGVCLIVGWFWWAISPFSQIAGGASDAGS